MFRERVVYFNTQGHDGFIDFIKAYAIICVVIGHALPDQIEEYTLFSIWGAMQVPLFVLIQVFHAYKKDIKPIISIKKLWKRIILPFLAVQLVIVLGLMAINGITPSFIVGCLEGGGKGPGSYYPWIYIQIALILPLLWPLFKIFTLKQLLLPFIILCVGMDVILSYVSIPGWLYRLMCVRYMFLIFLGMIWVKNGIKINVKTIILSLLTIAVTLFFIYTDYDLEPLFFTTTWKTHRWICYFYVSSLLCYGLWWLYQRASRIGWLNAFINEVARCSYEIFLTQMAVYVFMRLLAKVLFDSSILRVAVLIPCEIVLSIGLGILLRRKVIDRFDHKII